MSLSAGHVPRYAPCHDANVRPYAAYLRVYEPLSAFSDAEGRYWSEYAASAARPRRAAALDAEQAEALGRLIATPPIAAPRRESGHAYVRWADGVTYICPWQTRLRSWLELARLRSTARPLLSAAFAAGQADEALRDFASLAGPGVVAADLHPVLHLGRSARLVRAVRRRGAVARAGRGQRGRRPRPGYRRGDPDAHLRHGHVAGPAADRPGPERSAAYQRRRLNEPARRGRRRG